MKAQEIRTGLSPKYVQSWERWHAIRELVQNQQDACQQFGCRGRLYFRGNHASIHDYGPGLELRHLAIGLSEKGSDAAGQFGEGLKLALLVLARDGAKVELRSRDKRIIPAIIHDETLGTDVLAFRVSSLRKAETGTRILCECSQSDWEQALAQFPNLARKAGRRFEWVVRDYISFPGGSLYACGIKVASLKGAMYSYHTTDKTIANRDRTSVSGADAEKVVREALAHASLTTAKEILYAVTEQKELYESHVAPQFFNMSIPQRDTWYKAARAVFGRRTALAYAPQSDIQAEYLGYRIINPSSEWYYFLSCAGIPRSCDVARGAELKKPRRVPLSRLLPEERTTFRVALRLARKVVDQEVVRQFKVRVVDRLMDDAGKEAGGVCRQEERDILLARAILGEQEECLSTLLHEYAHAESRHGDCDAAFEECLARYAAKALLLARRKR